VATTTTRQLQPKLVELTFATSPPGLTLSAGSIILTGPTTLPSWERFAVPVEARDQAVAGVPWAFRLWSDGGAAVHTIVTPATPATYTAVFGTPPGSGPVVPPAGPGPVIQPPGPTPPGITRLRAAPRRFFARQRVRCTGGGPARTPVCRPLPTAIGTRLLFSLSTPARIAVQVVRPAAKTCTGRGPARRCRTSPARTVGRLAMNGRAGANALRVPGRLGGRTLTPGPYDLRVRAASGTLLSTTLRLRVVVRRG
jgi:hypothetical protein